jgi:hypothetical protein
VVGSAWRFVACVIGFGFGAVWMTAGLGSAILSLLCAAAGYGAAAVLERRRAAPSTRTRPRQSRRVDVAAEPGW